MLQRILDAIKSRGPLRPRQRDLNSARRDIDEYRLRAPPDLVEFFHGLDPAPGVLSASAYGHPVTANSAGLVFAWASGTNYIMLRIPRELQQQAIDDGGRVDPQPES